MNNNFVFMIVSIILIVFSIGLAIWALVGIVNGQDYLMNINQSKAFWNEPILKYPDFPGKAEIDKKYEYKFVICFNEVTKTNITYPEGTVCDNPEKNLEPLLTEDDNDEDDDDDDKNDEVNRQEKKAMEEAEEEEDDD